MLKGSSSDWRVLMARLALRSTRRNEDTNSQLKNKLKEIMIRVILFQQIWQLRWNGQNLWKKRIYKNEEEIEHLNSPYIPFFFF